MKTVFLCVTFFFVAVSAENKCPTKIVDDFPTEWVDMRSECTDAMKKQVKEELYAAMKYMTMGAYFSRADVNRPGFAKMFFESANEEREHSMKLIGYLLRRGELEKVSDLIPLDIVQDYVNEQKRIGNKPEWNDEWREGGLQALKDALRLEARVTQKIRGVIKACEEARKVNEIYNDYELVDYLTGEFLDEQHKGQRDLAGKISVLGKMISDHKELGEFLFDKKLL